MKDITLDIRKVKDVINLIFDNIINNEGVNEVDLNFGYYWDISAPERYNMDASVPPSEIGDLYEDYRDLMRIYSGEQPPLAYHLVLLAGIFRYVGEKASGVI